jgi:hypothetical protein
MNEKDLRLEFKRDTGLEPFGALLDDAKEQIYDVKEAPLTDVIKELDRLSDMLDIEPEDVQYIAWLEEKLCKLMQDD